jgi:hypothetical protein
MDVDTSKWSGEGTFTQTLIDCLRGVEAIDLLRVEDSPATRSDADYNFISNEIFVAFRTRSREERSRRFGFLPVVTTVVDKVMSMTDLQQCLRSVPAVGEPDYSDEAMMQYLRTERIVPPYQTRGYKLVELVRIYEVGTRTTPPS